ncbi:MAG: cytochrome c biogenesis protein CcdA [Chloroflexota bacterium]
MTSPAVDGSLVVAIPVALLAGLVSFLSPCVLPLVPGYLAYVTGLSGMQVAVAGAAGAGGGGAGGAFVPRHASTPRVLAGSVLFVAGFSLVFVSYGALFGGLGGAFRSHQETITRVLGVITIVMGLLFMGLFDRFTLAGREWRMHRLPGAGIAGAAALGMMFGLGWTPCIGPTLAAVLGLALSSGDGAARGSLLTLAYCVGLGLPFILAGLAMDRATQVFGAVRRRSRELRLVGGGFLVLIGILEVTGAWGDLMGSLQSTIGGWSVPL